jgi:hypothetical protein
VLQDFPLGERDLLSRYHEHNDPVAEEFVRETDNTALLNAGDFLDDRLDLSRADLLTPLLKTRPLHASPP